MHFGVPMVGAVLNTTEHPPDAEAIAFMLAHGEGPVLITDPEFASIIGPALEMLEGPKPLVIDALDPEYPVPTVSARSSTRTSLPAARPTTSGISPRTSGMRSPSTTHPAPPETPRGCSPSPRRLPQRGIEHHQLGHAAACGVFCGRCRCSTATAGASPGPWLPMPA